MARKAVLKRIRITKTGKMLRRPAGQNHFNAKESGKKKLQQKKFVGVTKTLQKKFMRYIVQH